MRIKKHIRQNVICLAAIGVKEGIVEKITKIVGRDITISIQWKMENRHFKSVDQYQIHQRSTTITKGAEQPELLNIRRQFVNIAETIFYWRETVVTNVKRMTAMSAKSLGYGMRVHINLRAIVILANT